ncbi:MAG: serpin family protein [Ruminococcaceae bacterium]|nr:serpin family protein [Oscillospiraceae bacterium]
MKREQILDMIGEAPDAYVADAQKHKKPHIPRKWKWLGAIAAMLAVVLLVNNIPGIPLIVSAKTVSAASDSRKMERPDYKSPKYGLWRTECDNREALVTAAQPPIADFSAQISFDVLSGTDLTNRIWSPINAYIALAMTAELTGSETQEQLLDVLGADDTEELRDRISAVWEDIYEDNNKEISVLANSLWLDRDVEYVQETMDLLAHDYYASVYQGDLGSARTNRAMTNWMRNQTGGLLKDRTGNLQLEPHDQVLAIASTVYFQSKWAHEFSASANTQGTFHTHDGEIAATFMNKKEVHMNYFWDEDWGAVEMYLENGSTMWFILPDEDKTVDDVLNDDAYMEMMTQDHPWSEEAENYRYMKVNLTVPQFDVSASADLKNALQSAGLTKIFEEYGNDFTPSIIRTNENNDPAYLDSINQDVRVKIDEKGVAAAAYIELNFGAGAAAPPNEVIDFVLDRPFVFAITKSSIPLFVGTVNCPS